MYCSLLIFIVLVLLGSTFIGTRSEYPIPHNIIINVIYDFTTIYLKYKKVFFFLFETANFTVCIFFYKSPTHKKIRLFFGANLFVNCECVTCVILGMPLRHPSPIGYTHRHVTSHDLLRWFAMGSIVWFIFTIFLLYIIQTNDVSIKNKNKITEWFKFIKN